MLALGAEGRDVGVLVWGGTGAGCFPFDTGGVGSKLVCVGWVCEVRARPVGLVGRLIA